MIWIYKSIRSKTAVLASLFGVLIVVNAAAASTVECANVTHASLSYQQTSISFTEGFQSVVITATIESHETGDGWDKYADEFQIRDVATGTVLGTRTLLHPHVHDQPFTRSLAGVQISDSVRCVVVAARDSVLGYCGTEFKRCRSKDPKSPWLDFSKSTDNKIDISRGGALKGGYMIYSLMLLVVLFPVVG